jgi:UDP-4-amino-4,6-dideoxy-N-acetyl-beta-L-altrosamine N-acetyltransferase
MGTNHGKQTNEGIIRLRTINSDDLKKIMLWRMSPEVTQYMYTDPQLTMEKQKKWYKKINSDATCKYWIITYDNIDIGVVGLTDIDLANRRCNWNWYIGEISYRGSGIAQQVQYNICDYVFEKLQLNRLYSEVLATNLRNIKAYEKCGYMVEGILKEHILKNNVFYDVAICGITNSKWKAIKQDYIYREIQIEE